MHINEQINCVKMEVRRREIVMPMMVEEGRISADRSDAEIGRMKAVLDTLMNLRTEHSDDGEGD